MYEEMILYFPGPLRIKVKGKRAIKAAIVAGVLTTVFIISAALWQES